MKQLSNRRIPCPFFRIVKVSKILPCFPLVNNRLHIYAKLVQVFLFCLEVIFFDEEIMPSGIFTSFFEGILSMILGGSYHYMIVFFITFWSLLLIFLSALISYLSHAILV